MLSLKIQLVLIAFAFNLECLLAADKELDEVKPSYRNFLSVTSGDVTINLIPVYILIIGIFLFKIALDFSQPNVATDFDGTSSGYGAPSTGYDSPSSGYGAPSSGYNAPSSSYGAPSSSYDAPASGAASNYQTKSDTAFPFLNFPSHRLLDLFTYLPSTSHSTNKQPPALKSDRLSNKIDDWKPSANPLYLEKKSV